ncbi:flagellar hook-associated protein FlgL [Methyloterricola oryzae]|uniref:flagellar hook-associated protein FlgL n=1 Tax=Methyloterricola oryzae TaxID=1495050 RepID=UPI0005EAE383|nr:flagellar hook-associated protein FlgL [Methyloterricola oryzae]
MRISTQLTQELGVNAMLNQQSKIAKSQVQMASGLRVVTPSDDAPAAVRALLLTESISITEQYQSNVTMATSRLSQEDSALDSVLNAMQRLNELAIQGRNDSLSESDRRSIEVEARQILFQVRDLANAKTDGGEYLFGGFNSTTPPYAYQAYTVGGSEVGGTYVYQGDASRHSTMVGPTFRLEDSDPGSDIFNIDIADMPSPAVEVQTPKTNLGSIDATISNAGALTGHDYKVDVTSAGVTITDLATGTASSLPSSTAGYPIVTQDGITFDLTESVNAIGTSGSTDSFQVNLTSRVWPPVVPQGASRPWMTGNPAPDPPAVFAQPEENILNVIYNFAENMKNNTPDDKDIERIQRAMTAVDDIRVTVGARLQALQSQDAMNLKFTTDQKGYLSTTQDLDYATAISEFNLQTFALKAAQQAYSKVQGLTLFDYI